MLRQAGDRMRLEPAADGEEKVVVIDRVRRSISGNSNRSRGRVDRVNVAVNEWDPTLSQHAHEIKANIVKIELAEYARNDGRIKSKFGTIGDDHDLIVS